MNPRLVGRLTVLPLLLLAMVLPGCSLPAADREIVVLGPWIDSDKPDDERDVFDQVLQAYAKEHDVKIVYQGTRAIGPALRAKLQSGALPDIAIMPNVGELAAYTEEDVAVPLTDMVETTPPAGDGTRVDHRGLWRAGKPYALAVKTDLKSMVLVDRTAAGTVRAAARAGWPQLLAATAQPGSGPGRSWCLGLSASSVSGWPGTDWIEDILLSSGGYKTYQEWASGRLSWTEVQPAWSQFLSVISDHTAGGAQGALLTTPQQAADTLLANSNKCTLVHQSSFFARTSTGSGSVDFVASPAAAADAGIEVSGDFAALFSDNPRAWDLLAHLVDAGAGGKAWVNKSGGIVYPVDVDPADATYQPLNRQVAEHLAAAPRRCVDASDAMPATMAGAFHFAVLESIAYPDRLKDILLRLDKVRVSTRGEWLDVACTP